MRHLAWVVGLVCALVACAEETPSEDEMIRETGYFGCEPSDDCAGLSCTSDEGARACIPGVECAGNPCECYGAVCVVIASVALSQEAFAA